MSEKQRNPQFITPKGVAIFPWLRKPDTKYKAEGEYRLKLRLSEEDAAPLIAKLQPVLDTFVDSIRKNPKRKGKKLNVREFYAKCVDGEGNETGDVEFNFKRLASGVSKKNGEPWTAKVDLFGADKRALPAGVDVWGGSLVKVSFEAGTYDKPATGIGLSFRLKAVQVIKLVEGGQRDAQAYGFGDESDDDDADVQAPRDEAVTTEQPADPDADPADEGAGDDEDPDF